MEYSHPGGLVGGAVKSLKKNTYPKHAQVNPLHCVLVSVVSSTKPVVVMRVTDRERLNLSFWP